MINPSMKRIGLSAMTSLVIVAVGGIAQPIPLLAQEVGSQPDQTSDADRDRAEPPPVGHDRAYETDRHKALSRRERFDRSGIPPGYSPYTWYQEMAATDAYDRGYEEGLRHGRRTARQLAADDRNESLVTSLMVEGGKRFRQGDYGAAARSFMLAAQQSQGDPASRLQAAHALTALRHYDEAYLLVRRAFQLQPKLAYLPLDVRGDYDDQTVFQEHLRRLEKDAAAAGDDPRLWALLGYYRFFSGDHDGANRALARAAALDPEEKFVADLRNVARISVPAPVSTKTPQ